MTQIKSILLILLFIISNPLLAQTNYYKMPDGKILSEDIFNKQRTDMIETGNVKVDVETGITRNDSIIKDVKLTFLDPFEKHREKIGTKFEIQKFKNKDGLNYSEDYLNGKPTLINFWATSCGPCVKEFPDLNRIKKQFKNSVNFVAISFDNSSKVENFLKKHKFDFEQITDSGIQLDSLKINAIPMSLLLDKNGKILKVYGGLITDNEKEVIETLKKSL